MTREEIVRKVKELNFSKGSYIVFGSCPLAAVGIREANDIDLLVSEELFEKLKETGWKERVKSTHDNPLVFDVFEAHSNWNFSPYSPTLTHLLSSAMIIDSVPFASLEEVRKWKAASGGPKHLTDVKLIDTYLQNNH